MVQQLTSGHRDECGHACGHIWIDMGWVQRGAAGEVVTAQCTWSGWFCAGSGYDVDEHGCSSKQQQVRTTSRSPPHQAVHLGVDALQGTQDQRIGHVRGPVM